MYRTPVEKTPEYLLRNSARADVWAAEFVRQHGGDEDVMLGWFANAMEVAQVLAPARLAK